MKLEGRVAFITGAGSGIGRSIAEVFASEGARVVATDLRGDTAEETVQALAGEGHLALACDVSDAAAVASAMGRVKDEIGQLDVLVNNAGVDRLPGDGFEELFKGEIQLLNMSDDAFNKMFAIHASGSFYCTREAARLMIPAKRGSIINLSSIAGLAGIGAVHYSGAKGAVLGMTRSLARELGRFNIRVNAICPGAIDTPMTAEVPEFAIQNMLKTTPLGRLGQASEISSTALFLASEDASYFTGQWLSPNGGCFIG